MRLSLLLLWLAAILSAPHAALAQAAPVDPVADPIAECSSTPDVPVNIREIFDDPAYDFTHPLAKVQQLASDIRHSIHETLTLGLTRYEPMIGFQVPIKGVRFPDGMACAHVDHVDITIGYRNVVVYIGSEIPRPSCGFDEVMAHEQKHIGVNRAILAQYAPLIQQKVKDYVRMNGVFREEDPDCAVKLLHQNMQTILNQVAEQMLTDNVQRQRAVDSPEEYRRISLSCNGQLQVIAGRYLHQRR